MRTTASLVVAAWLAASAAAPAGTFPYPTHVETLPNGLAVVLVPMPTDGLVSYWTIVRTGSRDEVEPGRTGFAHFFEHMMFRGTERYPAEVYQRINTEIGASANAFTTDDLTAYHSTIATTDLETVMRLESDRFQNLAYPRQAFETEAGAVYGEYRKNRTNPFFSIYEAIHRVAFERHTYGHTALGYEADIQAMPSLYDYSRSFFARFYRPENCVLLIAGDLEVEPTMALVRRHYEGWKRGYEAPQVPAEPPQTAERRVEVAYEGSSLPILWLAYKAPAFDPDDLGHAALTLLADLAFGETSALYRRLVLEEQAVEVLTASLDRNRDPGTLDVVARIKDPAKVDDVRAAIDATIAELGGTPPAAERLAALKARVKYGFLMGLDTPDGVAASLARILAVTADVGAVDRLFATYDRVQPADLQAAAGTYLVPEKRTVGILRGAQR